MLMLIISNTAARSATHGNPINFQNPRAALERVKTSLRLSVTTIHADTVAVDDDIQLVIGFVGRQTHAENLLVSHLSKEDNPEALLESLGVLGAYSVGETEDAETLSTYVANAILPLGAYLPGSEVLGGDSRLDVLGADTLFALPLNVVEGLHGSMLGIVPVDHEVDHETDGDVETVNEAVTETVTEVQPAEAATVVETQTKEQSMSTPMSNFELMRNVRTLHADLTQAVPGFRPLDQAFPTAERLRALLNLKLSTLPQPVMDELFQRADEVVACLTEMLALAATQTDELELIPAAAPAVDFDEEEDPRQELDEEEFEEEVDTDVERDDEQPDLDTPAVAYADDEAVGGPRPDLELDNDENLADKLPAIFLLTQGRLDEVEGVMAAVSEFAINFAAQQGEDFNDFNEADVAEAVEAGDVVSLCALLIDANWLTTASFESLYELDGELTTLAAETGLDVLGEVDESGVLTDADENFSMEGEEPDEDEGEEEEDDEEEEEAETLELIPLKIVPRLVLNVVADFNGHIYTRDQLLTMQSLESHGNRKLNLSVGISGKSKSTGAVGAYLRPIQRAAAALAHMANAQVMLPQSYSETLTAEQLADAIVTGTMGNGIDDLMSDVLGDLFAIEADEDGNLLLGFAETEDEEDSIIALHDLCGFSTKYSLLRDDRAFGPATIEVVSVLNMRIPALSRIPADQMIDRLTSLAAKMTAKHGIDVYPAVTFNAADRIFTRADDYVDPNVAVLPEVIDQMLVAANADQSPWAGAVFASHRGVTETGVHGIGLLETDGTDHDRYVPLSEVADIDVYASVANDAAAVLCTEAGEVLFEMGGDSVVLLTSYKEDSAETDDEDELEVDNDE